MIIRVWKVYHQAEKRLKFRARRLRALLERIQGETQGMVLGLRKILRFMQCSPVSTTRYHMYGPDAPESHPRPTDWTSKSSQDEPGHEIMNKLFGFVMPAAFPTAQVFT